MIRLLKKHWPLLGIGALLFIVGFYLFGTGSGFLSKQTLTALRDSFLEEGVKLKDISYTQNNPDEGLKWTLKAKEVTFSKDNQFMRFKDFQLKVESKERPSIKLEGKTGDYDKGSGVITLRKDLKGYTDNGYRFFTDHMVYNNEKGLIHTDDPVKIIGPFFSVEGRGLLLNLEKETLEIRESLTRLKNEAFHL